MLVGLPRFSIVRTDPHSKGNILLSVTGKAAVCSHRSSRVEDHESG
jgi:hypothetical protein